MKRRLYQLSIIIVSLFVIQGFSRSLIELWQQKQRLSRAKQELSKLEEQEANLKKQLAYYQSDEYVEKIAREKLMLGKEGEEVILLPPEQNQDQRSKPSSRAQAEGIKDQKEREKTENLPNWKKWAQLFGF